MKIPLLITLFFFNSSPLFSEEEAQLKQGEFKPYMLGHIYEGCPSNSTCNQATGQKRKKWLDVLKQQPVNKEKAAKGLERFRKENGIPLSFWIQTEITQEKNPKHSLIIWDSHCRNHQTKDPKQRIVMGEYMAADFKQVEKLKLDGYKIMLNRTYTLDQKEKIISYFHPRSDFPFMVDTNGIYVTSEGEGKYYSLRINNSGDVEIVPLQWPPSFPKEVECPKKLTEVFQSSTPVENMYMGHYCKAVWNNSTKKFQTFIFGWSCN